MNAPSGPASPGPSQAGIYDYLLDGDQHSPADRAAAEQAMAAMPQIRLAARENRAFLQRAVRYAARHGVRQYLDIGSGFPATGPVHEVAAEIVADPHVVYVDFDPAVIAVSRELLRSPRLTAVNHDWDRTRSPVTGRTRQQIENLFTGFDLVPPGLVTSSEWGTTATAPITRDLVLAGVGRRP